MNTLVFIDSNLNDCQTLVTGTVPGTEVFILSSDQDGMVQISTVLEQLPETTTVHIVSHGSPGSLFLGNSQLNLTNIYQYQAILGTWKVNQILLYGCNVASGDAGSEFISKLHQITGANITATATLTGNAVLGGNWDLEVSFPEKIDKSLVFNQETLATYQGVFAPTLVGEWDYLSFANAVTIVGNYAYALGDKLEIIDISNPANPIFKGSYDINDGLDVQIVGNYAYVASGYSGLKIIDITNPFNPILKGSYDTSGYAYDVQVVGNLAYVADVASGLQIIDITNPTNPTLKGSYNTSGRSIDVQIVSNLAYIADGESGLQIIDISNPLTPTLKGSYDTSGDAKAVQIVGNYAYVADDDKGLKIIDITNPLNPTLKGSYASSYAENVQITGNLAYVDDRFSGLKIIDITNPLNPTLKGSYDISSLVQDVQVVNNLAYVADYYSGLKIIDITNPLNPTLKGSYDISGYAKNVQIVSNLAYVADYWSGLKIIDITNPLNPTLKGSYDISGFAQDVQIVSNLAYVAGGRSGLQIIDISNPLNPTLKGTYDTSGYAQDVQIVGNLAYVADGSGLQIIDITNPLNPAFKGSYDTSGEAVAVQIVGNLAYVADYDKGLQIIDISNPLNPTLKGSYASGYAQDVQIVGNLAYVAASNQGLQIIDITNPLNPTLKNSYNTSGIAQDVQVVGNLAYVADGSSGLQIIDISNPTNPALKGSYDTSGIASGVKVINNLAYIADDYGGLKIIDVSEFASPYQGTSNDDTFIGQNGSYTINGLAGFDTIDYSQLATGITLKSQGIVDKGTLGIDTIQVEKIIANTNYINLIDASASSNIPINVNLSTNTLNVFGLPSGDVNFDVYNFQNVKGSQRDDSITGDNKNNILDGQNGNDLIYATTGNDTIIGGNGFDIVDYSYLESAITLKAQGIITKGIGGTDTVQAETIVANALYVNSIDASASANLPINANLSLDNLTVFGLPSGDVAFNVVNFQNVTGSQANDIITGDKNNNILDGQSGNDLFFGTQGRDTILGGNGIDTVDYSNIATGITIKPTGIIDKGALGIDQVSVEKIIGNAQFINVIDSSSSTTTSLNVDLFNNSLQVLGIPTGTLNFSVQNFSNVFGSQLADTIKGNDANNTLKGNDGNDTLIGGLGADILDGGNGIDTASYITATSAVNVNLGTGKGSLGEALNDTFISIENVTGSAFNDNITGNTLANILNGGAGNDILTGGAGNDILIGEAGNDIAIYTGAFSQYQISSTGGVFTIADLVTNRDGTDTLNFFEQVQFSDQIVTLFNLAPTNISLSNLNIAENQAISTVIGNFTTTDPNVLDNIFTYSLVSGTGATDNALFSISNNQLKANSSFDFETKNSYSIRVQTKDQGGLTFEKQLTIGVTNVNETPTNLILSNSNIAENQVSGTIIGNFTTTDPDANNTFTYSLVSGTGATDNALFSISNNQLKANQSFDFETKNSYSIRVQTKDQGGLTFEKQLTIGVTNVPESPTNLTLSNTNIAENQAIGTVIGNLTSTSPNANNTFTYSLITGTGATDNALFTISNNQLKANSSFDFETKNSYSIRVQTKDQEGLFFEKQLTIGVTNVNESPTNLILSNTNIAENQAIATVIGNFTTNDPDLNNTFTYSLITGTGSTDNALFSISNNQLKANQSFDFETKNSYSIRVQTKDQGGLTFEKQLTIGVTNVNESPTNLILSNTNIAENQAIATVIGNFTTNDPDLNNTFTYSLVSGTGSTDNALFSISNNQLKANQSFDFETKNSYSIRVQTKDQGGLTFEKQLTIGVTNVNESPTNLILSNTNIAENQAIGTVIGNLSTTDPDANNTFTYSLVSGTGATDNALFSISNNQLKANSVFDFETKNSYSIRVQTKDQGGLTFEKQLNIGITNLDNIITGNANNENFTTTAEKDIIDVQGGNDIITSIFSNLQQNDIINGGTGYDTLNITGGNATDSISIDLGNTTNQLNISGTKITNFEQFNLGNFAGITNFVGDSSNNIFNSGNGNDIINGGDGNDIINAGAGNDLLTGGKGKDILTGGLGSDRFDYRNLTDSTLDNFDAITDFNASLNNDIFMVMKARGAFNNVGAINTLDINGINSKLTSTNFAANGAAQFSVGSRSFIAINDEIAGFNKNTDSIIEITGFTGTLGINNFKV